MKDKMLLALFGLVQPLHAEYPIGGFKALRQRWQEHIKKTLLRPVLLIDEAQEMVTSCLNEPRLLAHAHFDSQCLITIVLSRGYAFAGTIPGKRAGFPRQPDAASDGAGSPTPRRSCAVISNMRFILPEPHIS